MGKLKEKVMENDISKALLSINDVLMALGKRIEALEKYVSEMPTPDKTYYQPKGYKDYLNIKGNYDEIYRRITELEVSTEEKIDGMQS
tara:strand:+ start:1033 stop:1296 length:264 start_codon:yes stop_codon:yes gene_type:complete